MALVVESASANTTVTTNNNNIVITKPSGVVSGDLLLGIVGADGGAGTYTMPTSYVLIQEGEGTSNRVTGHSSYKEAGGSEPADYTYTDSLETHCGKLFRISGYDTGNIIDASAETVDAGSSTITCPSVTTSVANCLVFMAVFQNDTDGTDFTIPSGTTDRGVFDSGGGADPPMSIGICSFVQVSAGATGTKGFTNGDSTETNTYALTLAIAPDTGGGFVPYPRPRGLHGGSILMTGGLD